MTKEVAGAPSRSNASTSTQYWLMKAEPDSRIVKGQDVAFSAQDFEKIGISPWDGVRNHEAKKIMKEKMKIGDQVLFYHSNCKRPGIAALAEVCKEGYPDYTAFDSNHPYYDPKSSKDKPTWYMVDVKFLSHLPHFVPLAFLQNLSSFISTSISSPSNSPTSLPQFLTSTGYLSHLPQMFLLNRGRLSVQPVEKEVWELIKRLGEEGGWEEEWEVKGKMEKGGGVNKGKSGTAKGKEKEKVEKKDMGKGKEKKNVKTSGRGKKRKAEDLEEVETDGEKDRDDDKGEDDQEDEDRNSNNNNKTTKTKTKTKTQPTNYTTKARKLNDKKTSPSSTVGDDETLEMSTYQSGRPRRRQPSSKTK